MTIYHALVTNTFAIADPAGDIVIEEGKILLGTAYKEHFSFPLTSRDGITRIEAAEPFANGNVKFLPKKVVTV